MSAKAGADTAENAAFSSKVLYFGWPNQPSSGIMENLHWKRLYMENFKSLIRKLRSLNFKNGIALQTKL